MTGVAATTPVRRTAVSADGTPIAYWASGTGTPLLLVHGAMSDHTRWDHLLPLLAPHAVFTMDRRGRGGSGDAADYAIEREFEDVAAVIDAVADDTGQRVDVFGHSYGALCALEAACHTTNVQTLALYEPPTHVVSFPAPLVEHLEALIADDRRDEAVEMFTREAVRSSDAEIARLRSLPTWEIRVRQIHTVPRELRAMAAYGFDSARFARLSVAIFLLYGGAHPEELLNHVDTVVSALPNAKAVTLDGQAHMAVDTAPDLLASTLHAVLGRSDDA